MYYERNKKTNQCTQLVYTQIRHNLTNVIIFAETDSTNIKGVCRIVLGSTFDNNNLCARKSNHPLLAKYADLIYSWLNGKRTELNTIPVILRGTTFELKVLTTVKTIGYGTTISYTTLAELAGYPKAIRSVGSVLKKNPLPIIIPCHRVIKKDGSIGGFMGKTTFDAIELKRRMLALEGVNI